MTGNRPSERTLRIIGGNWRSRKVSFAETHGLRPTPDRVRETLFNWLQFDIAGARCIEPYAGSGVLSMEALSRGARFVTIVDTSRNVCDVITRNLGTLGAAPESFAVIQSDAMTFIESTREQWDIAFLDPPFDSDELVRLLPAITSRIAPGGFVYLETPDALDEGTLPASLNLFRQKRAGQVHYALCKVTE